VGRSTLDTVLNSRIALSGSALQRLQSSLDTYRTGLVVTGLSLPNARPPEEVKPAFDDVNSAQQDKDRLISEARAYAAKVVPTARGQAAKIRTNADGYRTASIARATGDATRFSLLVDQYHGAPEVTRKRLWLETLQEVLGNNRRIIGGDSRQLLYVPLPGSTAQAPATPPVVPLDLASPTVESSGTERPARSADRPGRDQEPAR
jgi:membrane protease subunit HflK